MYDTPVSEVASPGVISVSPETSLEEAIFILSDMKISCIVVEEAGKPAGLLTERDVVRMANLKQSKDVKVSEVMTSPVVTVPLKMDILDLYGILRNKKIRHTVLVDKEGKAAGVVTLTDVIETMGLGFIDRRSIRHIMSADLVTASPGDSMDFIIEKMAHRAISCVVVVDNEKPVGLITERDVTAIIAKTGNVASETAGKWMSSPVETVDDSESLSEAIRKMIQLGYRRLAVVDSHGGLAGIVTQTDILKGLLEGKYIRFLQGKLDYKESALRKSEARMRAILTSVSEGIICFNLDFTILFANIAACDILGFSMDELPGHGMEGLLVFEDRMGFTEGIEDYVKNGENQWVGARLKLKGRKKDGEEITLDARVEEAKDTEFMIRTFIMSFRNVSA